MSGETDLIKLYSARILELAADIPHHGRLEAPDVTVKRRAPLCGSTVTVDLITDGDRITDYAAEVKACAWARRRRASWGRHHRLHLRSGGRGARCAESDAEIRRAHTSCAF